MVMNSFLFCFSEVSFPFRISLSFFCKLMSLIMLAYRSMGNSGHLTEEIASPSPSIIQYLLLCPPRPPPKDSFAWGGAVPHSFIILFNSILLIFFFDVCLVLRVPWIHDNLLYIINFRKLSCAITSNILGPIFSFFLL